MEFKVGFSIREEKREVASLFLILCLAGLGFWIFWLYPEQAIDINPESTPFFGKNEATTYLHSGSKAIDHTGRARAHKLILLLLLCALFLRFFWKKYLGVFNNTKNWTIPKLTNCKLNRLAFGFGMVFLSLLIVGLFKIPDFSNTTDQSLALVNIHYSVVIGQGDLILGGSRLLDELNPTYGALFTSLIGWISLIKGKLIPLGSIIRWVQLMDILYWVLVYFAYWKWSRKNLGYLIIPVLFLLPWYFSTEGALVPINHSPIRTLGITLSVIFALFVPPFMKGVHFFIAGAIGCLSILINVESGIAANAGIVVFLFCDLFLGGRTKKDLRICLIAMLAFIAGFLTIFLVYNIWFFVALGYLPTLQGWKNYVLPAIFGASGSWAVEYKFDIWPLFLFFHVCFYFCLNMMGLCIGNYARKRLMISVIFLVWFAYFVSRPDPEYLSSYFFLYGFLIIDLSRYVRFLLLQKRCNWVVVFPAFLILVILLGKSLDGVLWSWNPFSWDVKNQMRWQVPLVKKGHPLSSEAVFSQRCYFSLKYWQSLKEKSDFLMANDKPFGVSQKIFFSTDSYMLPRISGVLPYQVYSDPIMTLNKPTYERMLNKVIDSPFDEIYFDARDEKSLVWYGGMFQMVRRDLGEHFQKVGVESGWEIWKRISKN